MDLPGALFAQLCTTNRTYGFTGDKCDTLKKKKMIVSISVFNSILNTQNLLVVSIVICLFNIQTPFFQQRSPFFSTPKTGVQPRTLPSFRCTDWLRHGHVTYAVGPRVNGITQAENQSQNSHCIWLDGAQERPGQRPQRSSRNKRQKRQTKS